MDKWQTVDSYLESPYDTSMTTDSPMLIERDYWGNDPQPNTVSNILEISPVQLKIGGALGLIIGRELGFNPAVLFVSALRVTQEAYTPNASMRALFVALFLLTLFLAMTGMLLTWTFDTEGYIREVQGRYLLPMMPALLIAIAPKRRFSSSIVARSVPFMCSLDFAYLMWICMRVMVNAAV